MKIKCDFCKTEYSLATTPTTPVKCAVCGHVWTVTSPNAKLRATQTFIAALCALLAAGVFAYWAIKLHNRRMEMRNTPLIAELIAADVETDDNGVAHIVIQGRITNISDELYGVPDIVVVSRDGHGNPLARQRVMPPATLLDVGKSVDFTQKLNTPTANVKQITIEMQSLGDDK